MAASRRSSLTFAVHPEHGIASLAVGLEAADRPTYNAPSRLHSFLLVRIRDATEEAFTPSGEIS